MIYLANVSVEINRAGRKTKGIYKYFKESKTVEMVYTEGSEKKKDSYFNLSLERLIDMNWDKKESYKITLITKQMPLGLEAHE